MASFKSCLQLRSELKWKTAFDDVQRQGALEKMSFIVTSKYLF